MSSHSFANTSSFGSDHGQYYSGMFDPFSTRGSGSGSVAQALVLDSKRGELVKAPVREGKKGLSEAKTLAALKNHSEAERRRRERINSHLSTLRGLVPCTRKMDKATLLAEVIGKLKELKKNAAEASEGLLVPMDADAIHVEPYGIGGAEDNSPSFKASLCCGYRPELLSDVREALEALPVKLVRTEISTLGERLKLLFVFTSETACGDVANSVQEALSSVLDKASALAEYLPRTTLPSKRRRFSYFDSSSSSS